MIDNDFKAKIIRAKDLSFVESAWHMYLSSQTPMGELLLDNSLLRSLCNKHFDLIHFTSNLDDIVASKILMLSGGGLGACIYGVPISAEGKIHNLGYFLKEVEIPNFQKAKNITKSIEAILIRIKNVNKYPTYLNYLTFGKKYLLAYLNLISRGVIPESEKIDLDIQITKKYKRAFYYIEKLRFANLSTISNLEFMSLINAFNLDFPELRNIYFETVIEYLFLFQDDDAAMISLSHGELNNKNPKETIFNLCPDLYKKFSTKNFTANINQMVLYLQKLSSEQKLVKDFNEDDFVDFVKWRFAKHLFVDILENLNPDFEDSVNYVLNLDKIPPNFVGNMYYKNSSYVDEIEQEFSFVFKNSTLSNSSTILTYKDTPKGEIGINTYNLKMGNCEFFKVKILSSGDFKIIDKIDISFGQNLVFKSHRLMRDPH